jgi:ketosteroid isomerase-like protein
MSAIPQPPASADRVARNKKIVDAFYQGGVRGDITAFEDKLAGSFVCSAPNYLPWGGDSDAHSYINDVLPQVAVVLDFGRFSYASFTAEGDHVVALINVGVRGTPHIVKISEHWDMAEDGKALALWVAYFEPAELLDLIERNKAK